MTDSELDTVYAQLCRTMAEAGEAMRRCSWPSSRRSRSCAWTRADAVSQMIAGAREGMAEARTLHDFNRRARELSVGPPGGPSSTAAQ